MKNTLFGLLLLLSATSLSAQTALADTTVYQVAEQMPYPILKSCNIELHPGWTEDSVRRCAEVQLLTILSHNIRYPEEARKNNTEGTVVVTFVVEPDGKMTHYQILKDIGNGCGEEARRVLQALEGVGLRWKPAQREGKVVRMRQSLPLRFKLQEPLPYYLTPEGDTIYSMYDAEPGFRGGMDSLVRFVLNQLQYPPEYADSCKTGVIEMSLLIGNDGSVEVENQLDFSNLGSEFQWQALRLVNRTAGYWTPAQYQGKPVATTLPFRVLFKSNKTGCAAANDRFDRATLLADEGATFFEGNKTEEAIQKWTEALTLQPDNTEWLYYRGTTLLNMDRKEDACKDFNRVKEILGITWFEAVRKLVCGW
ncbi:MAG: TonB family protein [Lewinellaceae bacterium]|nr:TonB family protein [Lewinellaceae bacterium]